MSVWVFIMKSIYLYKRVSIRSKPFPHPLDKQTLRSHRRCSALHHRSLDVYSCKCKPFHVPTHQSKPFIACAATPPPYHYHLLLLLHTSTAATTYSYTTTAPVAAAMATSSSSQDFVFGEFSKLQGADSHAHLPTAVTCQQDVRDLPPLMTDPCLPTADDSPRAHFTLGATLVITRFDLCFISKYHPGFARIQAVLAFDAPVCSNAV